MIGHADELWSSSADLIGSPTKSYPIAASCPSTDIIADRSTSEQFDVEKEFKQSKSQPLVCNCNRITGAAGMKSEPLEEKVCTFLLLYALRMARSFVLMTKRRHALHSSFLLADRRQY